MTASLPIASCVIVKFQALARSQRLSMSGGLKQVQKAQSQKVQPRSTERTMVRTLMAMAMAEANPRRAD